MAGKDNTGASSYLDWSDKGKPAVWRYVVGSLLGIAIILVFSGIGSIPLIVLRPDYQSSLILRVTATLLNFVLSFFTLPLLVRVLHGRPFWSIALPAPRVEGWNFWAGFLAGGAVSLAASVLFSLLGLIPIEANPEFSLGALLPLIVIGFVGIFMQASSEEFFFRGYLGQFARSLTSNPYLFIGVPALIFALPHIINIAALGGTLLVAVPYMISGVLYGWAAYRTGSLWMSVGLHLSNNYTSLVLIGTKGDALPSAAPFQIEVPGLAIITAAVAVQAVTTAAVLTYLLRRRGR